MGCTEMLKGMACEEVPGSQCDNCSSTLCCSYFESRPSSFDLSRIRHLIYSLHNLLERDEV